MEEIEIRSGAIDVGECLTEGWELLKPKYFLFFAVTLLMLIFSFLLGAIPYAGGVLNLIVVGPLMCGIYLGLSKLSKNDTISFGTFFEGFSMFVPAFLIMLIQNLPSLIATAATAAFSVSLESMPLGSDPIEIIRNLGTGVILTAVAMFVLSIVVSLVTFFSLPLIADRGVGFSEALSLSVRGFVGNPGGVVLAFLLSILILIVGVIALCIGLLFVMPIINALTFAAYKRVFPSANPEFAPDLPPPPSEFGSGVGTAQWG